jgi:hypothetical protein
VANIDVEMTFLGENDMNFENLHQK